MKKTILFILFSLLITTIHSQTPSWQWIKSGGSGGYSSSGFKESCKYVKTDNFGNIYGISLLYSSGIVIDTIQKSQGFGYDDFCVFSYRCNGDFRWARFFGCSMGYDYPGGIAVDGMGNVYVAGNVGVGSYGDGHFGDSIIPQTSTMSKSAFVAKIDSTGHTEWLNMPGPAFDNVGEYLLHVELDNQGNINVLTWFASNTIWNTFNVPERGHYIMKFNKDNGALMGITKLEFKLSNVSPIGRESLFFTIDNDNSIYLMSDVVDTVVVGTDTISTNYPSSPSIYKTLLVKFSPNGAKMWHTVVSGTIGSTLDNYKQIYGKPLIYGDYVYIGGQTQSYPGSTFFGTAIHNPIASQPTNYTKLISRFNKHNGNFISVINLKNNNNIFETPLSVRDDKIIAAGSGGQLIIMNQNDTLQPTPSNFRNYPFIVEMDTALSQFNWGIATIGKGETEIDAITVDNRGNIYVAGNMNDSIYNSFGVGTAPAAGGTDFFIAKIAGTNTNCGCVYAWPSAQVVSFSGNTLTVKGSASNQPDSLYWYWGDGDSSLYSAPGTDISHTYQGTGPYTVCLRAWNYCGIKDTCITGLYAGMASMQNKSQEISVYPNPANDVVYVEINSGNNIKFARIEIVDSYAKVWARKEINAMDKLHKIKVSNLPSGVYILNVYNNDNVYREKICVTGR